MNKNSIEDAIIKYARAWINTPFHSQGRIKGIGCDCLGLILGVATKFDVRSILDGRPLSEHDISSYHVTKDSYLLFQNLSKHLQILSVKTEFIQPTNLLLLDVNQRQHIAIISQVNRDKMPSSHNNLAIRESFRNTESLSTFEKERIKYFSKNNHDVKIIHACYNAKKVVEHSLLKHWYKFIYCIFRFSISHN